MRDSFCPFLKIGMTLAIFILCGTVPVVKDKFTINVRGEIITSTIFLRRKFVIPSYPEPFFVFRLIMIFFISPSTTGVKKRDWGG